MKWIEAIEDALKDHKMGLRCDAIAEYAKKMMSTSDSDDPYKIVNGMLNKEVKNEKTNFVKVGKNHFVLKKYTTLDIPYGVYWQRDKIEWKSPNLIGYKQYNSTEINFNNQIGVYLLYDKDDKVVYVGYSMDAIISRLKDHTMDDKANEWCKFSWFGFHPQDNKLLTTKNIVLLLEAILIKSIKPKFNSQEGRNFKGVLYVQK
jgi:hypothetical protein